MAGCAEGLLTGRAVVMAARPMVAILRMVEECMFAVVKVVLVVWMFLVQLCWMLLAGECVCCYRRAWWRSELSKSGVLRVFCMFSTATAKWHGPGEIADFCGHVMKQCRV